jgi:hypothetical protein
VLVLAGFDGYRSRRDIVTKHPQLRPGPPPIVLADISRPMMTAGKIATMPGAEL